MKDEIKEILDCLKDNDNYIEDIGGEHKRIGLYEAKILLDYITNLQDRIDEAIEYINKSEYATIESNKHIHADNDGRVYNLDVLLNILQGKSDE